MRKTKILLSSVCKPIGPAVGDSESVGYELLHGQVTRAQSIYSPRVTHKQFSLDYIAENIDAPSVVLHYPSQRQFIRELEKGYEYVGIAFVLSTFHHAVEMCRLVRQHAPRAKIVLGGYGTIATDEELQPHCDFICREEGVGFFRRVLGERPLALQGYRHPEIASRLRVFGIPVAHTAMIFAGLGCPNGCDFCCTSHFFKRKHIRLLPDGKSIFRVMSEQRRRNPGIDHTILDEDFLLNHRRANEYLEECRRSDEEPFSTFCFASVKALSRFSCDELLEMGIDGVWVGYEGKESGYAKHAGRDIDELICDLQSHGITVLTSMIVGIPYQTDEIARSEFGSLMKTEPALSQFLIYGPTPGTPFYEKVMEKDLLQEDLVRDRRKYYKACSGFTAMVKHPFLRREQIEALQREFYDRDFQRLGPSIFRIGRIKKNGWLAYRNHENPRLRKKAVAFRRKLAMQLAALPVGVLGPGISMRNRKKYLLQILDICRTVRWYESAALLASPVMVIGAMVSWASLKLGWFQHPITRVHRHRGMRSGFAAERTWNGILGVARRLTMALRPQAQRSGP
jgi:radical SAM superfamily enzyme YgiQ (UPF0313 family)